MGPVTAAQLLTAFSHHGRLRSEAAFAALGGAAPIPASSGHAITLTGGNRHDVTQLLPLLDDLAARPVAGKIGRPRQKPDAVLADRGHDFTKHRRLLCRTTRARLLDPLLATPQVIVKTF